MSRHSVWCVAVLVGLGAPVILAHEGHGQPALARSFLHYLVEPQHALPALAVALAAVLGLLIVRRRRAGSGPPSSR